MCIKMLGRESATIRPMCTTLQPFFPTTEDERDTKDRTSHISAIMGSHETYQYRPQMDVFTVQWTLGESRCGINYTLYNLGMSTSEDGPRVRPIPSEDDEKDTPGESLPGDRTVNPVAKRPWWSIGRRLIDGIPFTNTKRH
jgi:hypothetical protein